MRLFASLKLICAAALLMAGFCSCATTETHNGRQSMAEKEREAWWSNYIDRVNQEHGLNL